MNEAEDDFKSWWSYLDPSKSVQYHCSLDTLVECGPNDLIIVDEVHVFVHGSTT